MSALLLQVLFQQFKFFLNLYFLVIALTQFIPQLRIGYLYTYWGPLVSSVKSWEIMLKILTLSLSLSLSQVFVVSVTMLRELYDDFKRYVRDREVNGQRYYRLTSRGAYEIPFLYFKIIEKFL